MINTGLDHHEVFGEGITSDWEAGVVSGAARLAASKILRTIIRPQFVRQFSVQDATDQVKRPDWRFSIKWKDRIVLEESEPYWSQNSTHMMARELLFSNFSPQGFFWSLTRVIYAVHTITYC